MKCNNLIQFQQNEDTVVAQNDWKSLTLVALLFKIILANLMFTLNWKVKTARDVPISIKPAQSGSKAELNTGNSIQNLFINKEWTRMMIFFVM